MSSRQTNLRRPSNLSIRPPSPSRIPPNIITTPTTPSFFPPNPIAVSSPRRAPLPPSPDNSVHSYMDDRGRQNLDPPPPIPRKDGRGAASPHRRGEKGGWAGAYDNKLVSSSLSQLPPLPPLSPTPTGGSQIATSHSNTHHPSSSRLHPPTVISHTTSYTSQISSRPSTSTSSTGLVVLSDGTALATSGDHERSNSERSDSAGTGRTVSETMAHSSPSSPWSLLTVHVLPLFAGGPLKTPIEDLNHLCNSHIIQTSQRAAPSRILAVLTSDLRDFIVSGMLTLKAKFETLEEAKVVNRAAEVWSFFWAQVLPYLEGVFLPFTQVRDLHSSGSTKNSSIPSLTSPIAVRHLLLSGFLLHILLPLLPRILPHLSGTPRSSSSHVPPTTPDLQRLLQMSLVLSTQARYSSFIPLREPHENERRDEEVRSNVESLGKTVRWRMAVLAQQVEEREKGSPLPPTNNDNWTAPQRNSLQRGPSLTQSGRHRRRGWRASSTFGHDWGQPPEGQGMEGVKSGGGQTQRQNSDFLQAPEQRWGRPRVDEEDDDDNTPGQSFAFAPPSRPDAAAASFAPTTVAGSTVRGESLASYGESQRTPQAGDMYGLRRGRYDEGDSEVTPVALDSRRLR